MITDLPYNCHYDVVNAPVAVTTCQVTGSSFKLLYSKRGKSFAWESRERHVRSLKYIDNSVKVRVTDLRLFITCSLASARSCAGARTHTHKHTHTCALARARTHTHTLTRALARSRTHTHTHTRTHARTHTNSFSITHARTHTCALSLSLSLTHSHTHSHTHSLTPTHTGSVRCMTGNVHF